MTNILVYLNWSLPIRGPSLLIRRLICVQAIVVLISSCHGQEIKAEESILREIGFLYFRIRPL